MHGKKPIGLVVFGILAIAIGLFVLHTIALHLISIPWAALGHEFHKMDSWSFISSVTFFLALAAGFIVSGIGVLRAKPWSRHLLLTTTGVALWGLVNRLIVLGPCTEEFYYISRFFIGALFIGYFNRSSVRTVFPYRKGLRVLTILWIVVLSIEIVGAGILWFRYGGHRIPTLQQGVYQSRDESFCSEDYVRTLFPLKYTLAIPKGLTPFSIDKYDAAGITILLLDPKDGAITMSDPTLLHKMYAPGIVLGYRNPFRYYEKLYSERFGLYFLIMRMLDLPLGIKRVEEAQIDGLSAFIKRGESKDKLWGNFYLFKGSEIIGHGDIFGFGFTGQQMDNIISSLRLQDNRLKSARDFFQEGKTLFQQGDLQGATFSFVSALCLEWENPEYHYYLGRTFLETENHRSARKHLIKAIRLQPDFPEAGELLREVETRQDKETSKR